jgi:hypothetical protein
MSFKLQYPEIPYPKIPWKILRDTFEGEWVELVEYEWDWGAPFPKWARVRHHAPERSELMASIQNRDNLILFIGGPDTMIEQDPSLITL